jgi:hypothetical protein
MKVEDLGIAYPHCRDKQRENIVEIITEAGDQFHPKNGPMVTILVSEIASIQQPLSEEDKGAYIGNGYLTLKNGTAFCIRHQDYGALQKLMREAHR